MTTAIATSKKITLATVKSFIRKNRSSLFINVKSSFDGMVDGCTSRNEGFIKAADDTNHPEHSFGVKGAWFVGQSRDYFKAYESETATGFEVSNSCGHFILAIYK
jgi:hypothetical protein